MEKKSNSGKSNNEPNFQKDFPNVQMRDNAANINPKTGQRASCIACTPAFVRASGRNTMHIDTWVCARAAESVCMTDVCGDACACKCTLAQDSCLLISPMLASPLACLPSWRTELLRMRARACDASKYMCFFDNLNVPLSDALLKGGPTGTQ